MPNLVGYNATEALAWTPAPTPDSNSDSAIIDILIYLFAMLCAQNPICSGIFRIIFALMLEALSMVIATLPIAKLLESRSVISPEYESSLRWAQGSMLVAWIASNVGGAFAFKAMYNNQIPNPDLADTVDKFDAATDAMLGASIVTTVYTGAAAGIYTFGPPAVASMYKKFKDTCCSSSPYDYAALNAGIGSSSSNKCCC